MPTCYASTTLAAELTRKVRESGVVVWLDAERRYSTLVSSLQAPDAFPYPIVSFSGSYLELMLALEPYGNGLERDHVLIHLPGLNKDSVKETPVLELYEAGTVFEKALPTVVREAAVGVARPEEVDAFLRGAGLTLEAADAWLDGLRSGPRDRLTLLLESLGVDDVALSLFAMDGRFREELEGAGKDAAFEQVLGFLERSLGIDSAWRTFRLGEQAPSRPALAALVSSWVMAVEFVHDLKVEPTAPQLRALRKLAPPLVKEARRVAERARDLHPDVYEGHANELQELLEQDRTGHAAATLGSVDTFRFEESTMRLEALRAARAGEWSVAAGIAGARTTEGCFWVRRAPKLQRTWELVRLASALGQALAATRKALDKCASLEEIVARYAQDLAPIDRQHRAFEQRAHAHLSSPDLDDREALIDVRRAVRRAYRSWADATNGAFHRVCMIQGALPGRSLRQRTLFDDEVRPLVEGGATRVAYFLIDAMRFEMGQGLAEELGQATLRATVRARLAELPTVTAVGMNVLAPVARNGRLQLAQGARPLAGFSTGEFVVSTPKDRVKAISQGLFSSLAEDIELDDFADMQLAALKRRLNGKPSLVVVRSRELDDAGEANLHLATFDQTLALLKNAVALLAHAGVERFVLTSDHGFLLQDATVEAAPLGANKRVAERRHALLAAPSGMADVLDVRWSDLEVDAKDDDHLVFRGDTAPWKVSGKIAPFVHGGNSLQERVIPVLLLDRQRAAGKFLTKYEVVAWPEPAQLGRQRLRVAIRLQNRENATLGFASPKAIPLSLRVKHEGRPRDDIALVVLDAEPPATLVDGQVHVPPNREEALVEFELTGMFDEKVRIEIFHTGATEEVLAKVVEGFFDVARSRRLGKLKEETTSVAPAAPPAVIAEEAAPGSVARPAPPKADPSFGDLIEDPTYKKIFELLAQHQIVNEAELEEMLGSPRRLRAFGRAFDELLPRVPFEVEIVLTAGGLKAYKRRS